MNEDENNKNDIFFKTKSAYIKFVIIFVAIVLIIIAVNKAKVEHEGGYN